jgi:ADP-heptose:LPS heptosyltransferase
LLYIACAFNKPVVVIWGGTSPKLDLGPYYGRIVEERNQSKTLYKNFALNLPCQPCSNFGTKNCPLGHFKCMRLQDIETIKTVVMETLKR